LSRNKATSAVVRGRWPRSVSVSGRVIYGKVSFVPQTLLAAIPPTLWTNDQTTALLRTTIDCLDDINQLLLILQNPVELVVVTGTEIAHHVLVAEEEHEGDGIV
jgi:hypothetical protein